MQRAECSTVDWSNFFPKIENTATDINSMLPVRHNEKKERRTFALFHFWNQILKSWFEEKKPKRVQIALMHTPLPSRVPQPN